jgi:hypothetical protein
MRMYKHVIYSLLVSLVLFPFVGWYALIVFLAGFLTDADHVFWCYLKFRDINLKRCKAYCQGLADDRNIKEFKQVLLVFHTFEFWLLLAVSSLFFPFALYILVGALFHLVLDIYSRLKLFGTVGHYSVLRFLLSRKL